MDDDAFALEQLKKDIGTLRKQNQKTQHEIKKRMKSYDRNENELVSYRMMKEHDDIISTLQTKYNKAQKPEELRSARFNKKGMSIRDQWMESKRIKSTKRAKEWAQIIRMESHQNKLQMKLNQQNGWISKLDDIAFNDHDPLPQDDTMNMIRAKYTKQMQMSKQPQYIIDQTWSPLNEGNNNGNDHKLSRDISALKEEIDFLQRQNEKEDNDDRMIRKVSRKMERMKEEIEQMQSESMARNKPSRSDTATGINRISNRANSMLISEYDAAEFNENDSASTQSTKVSDDSSEQKRDGSGGQKWSESSSKSSTKSTENSASSKRKTEQNEESDDDNRSESKVSQSLSSYGKNKKEKAQRKTEIVKKRAKKLLEKFEKQSAYTPTHKIHDVMSVDMENRKIINKMWDQLMEKQNIINTEKKLDKYKTMKLKELAQKQQKMEKQLMKKDKIIKKYQKYGNADRIRRCSSSTDEIIERSIRAQKYRKEAMKTARDYKPYAQRRQVKYSPKEDALRTELMKCKKMNAVYVSAINDLRRKYAQMSNKLNQNYDLRDSQMRTEQIINDLRRKYDRLLYKRDSGQSRKSEMELTDQIYKMKEFNKLLRLHQIEMLKAMRHMQQNADNQMNVIEDIKEIIVTNNQTTHVHKGDENSRLSEKRRRIYAKGRSVPVNDLIASQRTKRFISPRSRYKTKHESYSATNYMNGGQESADTTMDKYGDMYEKADSVSLNNRVKPRRFRKKAALTTIDSTKGRTNTFEERYDDICTDEMSKVHDLIKRAKEKAMDIDMRSREMTPYESSDSRPEIYASKAEEFEERPMRKDRFSATLAAIDSVQSNINAISNMSDIVTGRVSIIGRNKTFHHVLVEANRRCIQIGRDEIHYTDILSVLPDTESDTKWTIKSTHGVIRIEAASPDMRQRFMLFIQQCRLK